MIQSVEGVIDSDGNVQLPRGVRLPSGRRAIVTVLDGPQDAAVDETALLSEGSLAEDWLRPEEDEAWSYLQNGQ